MSDVSREAVPEDMLRQMIDCLPRETYRGVATRALDSLLAERDGAHSSIDHLTTLLRESDTVILELQAERDEARRERDAAVTTRDEFVTVSNRRSAAEAEVARLRGALKEIHSKPYRAEEITARVFLASVGETDG